MSTNNQSPNQTSLFKKKSVCQEVPETNIQTPESPNYLNTIDLKNLKRTQEGLIREFKAFVMGIAGGDCAGKKEFINVMFEKEEIPDEHDKNSEYWRWKMPQTGESVAVLHQNYFIKDERKKFSAEGTDWNMFKRKAFSLIMGNEIMIKIKQGEAIKKVRIPPAKVLCIEGSHIFSPTAEMNCLMNIKVFIDSDSDVRLSRRIYKDTVENNLPLDMSILQYMREIKPAYENQIEPTKVECDLVVLHIGNGYADHKSKDKLRADMSIKNITNLLLTQLKRAIKILEEEEEKEQMEEKEKKKEEKKNKKKEEEKKGGESGESKSEEIKK